MPDSTDQIGEFVRSFVLPSRQDRWIEKLSNPRKRAKIVHRLAGLQDFEPDVVQAIPATVRCSTDVIDYVAARLGVSDDATVYVISELPAIDGSMMAIAEVIRSAFGLGLGTACIVVGLRIGYSEVESGRRFVLRRQSDWTG